MRNAIYRGLLAALLFAGCASSDTGNPDLIEIPGSTVKILRTGPDTYSISLDGASFFAPRKVQYAVRLSTRQATFDPKVDGDPVPVPGIDDASNDLYVVQFVVHPLEAIQNHLVALGARPHRYLPTNSLLVRMSPAVADEIKAQRYVRWLGPYRPSYRLSPSIMQAPSSKVYVRVLDVGMKHGVAEHIRTLGGTVHETMGSSPLLVASLSRDALIELSSDNDVEFIDAWGAPEADMDIAREISGANQIETIAGYTGAGIRAEVMDGNVLETHGDFASRPLIFHGTNRSGDMSHGTATTGIVFGDGTGDPKGKGILYKGQPIFASYQNLADRYAHTGELLQPPYFASFQSNSWGGQRTLEYTNVSAEMDRILFDHDILIFQSQSNAGSRMSRPEAWAKNIVSVGAFKHQNTLAPEDDRWQGGASIGPAADGRIKPDLSHFYDATHAPTSTGPAAYREFGGTSGATPITAGHAGIFLEMWADGLFGDPGPGSTVFERRPHMTTSKAMLINTAWRYSFANVTADMNRHHQGWGRVDLATMHALRDKLFIINETDVLSPLASTQHQLTVAAGEPELRVTMVYADPPGTPAATHARVNDLTLRVVSPSGIEYFGNHGLRESNHSLPGGTPDTIDTVENVFIMTPEPGTWTVEVRADEIISDGHTETPALDADYALVVSGVSTGNTPPPPPPTGRVRISQVAYDTPGDDAVEEWLELYNPTATSIDVSSYRIADTGGTFTLPPNTIIAPGTHIAVARTTSGFSALFGTAPAVAGMTLSLGNSGDELRLLDPNGIEIDRVQWENPTAGWPIAAPTGSSIRRTDPNVDTDTAADWQVATPAVPRS